MPRVRLEPTTIRVERADSELRRYCKRILRVRSTGWTQGIFAKFATESMVPKGPEWGGGNWVIKHHPIQIVYLSGSWLLSMEQLANQKNVLNLLMIEKCKSVKPSIEDLARMFKRIDKIFLSHDLEEFLSRSVV
nr:actin cytoskeleton-regulatory complex protein [Tanacetum cinerariifolium]